MAQNRRPRTSQNFIFILIFSLLLACGKKDRSDLASSLGGSPLTGCGDDLSVDYEKPGSLIIPYYITPDMIDPVSGQLVCTTKGIKEKIKKVFDMYASVPEMGYSFRYAGPSDGTPSSCYRNTHNDGAIHVFLNQDRVCAPVPSSHGEYERDLLTGGPLEAPRTRLLVLIRLIQDRMWCCLLIMAPDLIIH